MDIFLSVWIWMMIQSNIPMGDIVRKHGLKCHLYADNSQLYLTFDHNNPDAKQSTISTMAACIAEIKALMLSTKLKLNDGKTDFLHFHLHHRKALSTAATTIKIGDDVIDTAFHAKHLGVLILDDNMTYLPTLHASVRQPFWTCSSLPASENI